VAAGTSLFLMGRVDLEGASAEPGARPAGRRSARFSTRVLAQVPGPTLDPALIPKYVTSLLIPPVMPQAGKAVSTGGKNADYYEISVRQFQEQILPTPLGKTTVWGYGAVAGPANSPLVNFHNAPSLTIEAQWNTPVRIKWINDLKDANGNYLPHLLPIDPTLHWANPPQGVNPAVNGTGPRDSRPVFTSTPGRYTGPVPMVTHVHGAVAVNDDSDGYAEAWYLPAANNIPTGYATEGTWYNFFKGKAQAAYKNVAWGRGYAIFQYPNSFRAATIWYHDHALGMTANNVYAGPAGFFIIRGGPDGDAAVIDSRSGNGNGKKKAVLPGPAPQQGDPFPPTMAYYEIPIAIQDRAFNADGSLFYPDSRAYFGDSPDPIDSFIPNSDVSPIHNPEFFGNCIMVNGNTWPKLTVEARRYRFRFLNGCDSRTLVLKFDDPRVQVYQIGNEGGLLPAPVNVNATPPHPSVADSGKAVLLMGGAERADLIVDFGAVPAGTPVTLLNVGPDAPFGGFPIDLLDQADALTTGQVMRFDVVPAVSADATTPPQFLKLPAIAPLPAALYTRKLVLAELTSGKPDQWDVPVETRLGTVAGDGNYLVNQWGDGVTENPAVGATEIWEFYNTTIDAHPMHIHEVAFEVVNRQSITITNQDTEAGTGTVALVGNTRDPQPWEKGRKDTVIALPGEVTRVKATFSSPGQFVWHCHIVEHEDNEMMRPYRIGPEQLGQPA